MNRKLKHVILGFLCCGVLLSNAQRVDIRFDQDTILLGDHVLLNIEVVAAPEDRIFLPEFVDSIGNFDIIENYKPDTTVNTISQNILLTQFNPGIYQFGLIPALIQRENGKVDTFVSNTVILTVNTMEVDTSQAIKPIKAVKTIPFPWKTVLKQAAFILIPILILIALLIWYLIRRKKLFVKVEKPKTMLDHYHDALNRLESIDKQKLWQNAQTKEYYLGISEVLRTYLEGRFGVAAMESTTDEIRENLFLQDALKNKLGEILAQADLAKFAKFKPLDDENRRMMKMAKDFVRHTKPQNLQENDAK